MSEPPPYDLPLDGPTRVAMVGAGFISDFHLDVLSKIPDVELTAICDVDLAAAQRAAERYGAREAVTELERLPELGVQIAHLAVPPDRHFDLTRRLLELGLGVFAEKPIALSTAETIELADLARERRLPLAVNHNNVFHPAFRRMVARIEAGEIGRVEHVQLTFSVPLRQLDASDYTHWMFRAPRNIVFEQTIHPLSQIHHLLGPVKRVERALLGTRELNPGQVFHERWAVAAEAERGTAQLYTAFGRPFTRCTLQVLGSDGSLEADLFHDGLSGEEKTHWLDFWNSFLAQNRRGKASKRDARRVLRGWLGFTLGLRPRRDAFYVGMQGSIEAFHRALRAGERLPNDAQTAVEVGAWCDAIAGEISGEAPPLPDFPEPGAARPGEVVVLGATGFIGRCVMRALLEREVPVTAIVRRRHSLPPVIVDAALDGRLRLLDGSLEDTASLAQALSGARACIQLATGGGDTWEVVQRSMVAGSVKIAEACREAGVRRLVYVSSLACLYTGKDCGTRELEDSTQIDPRIAARSVYARGKAATEEALLAYHSGNDVGLVIARPGVVLGAGTPMQHSGLGLWLRDNHCAGWGAGEHPLPLVLAEDVAEGLVAAALHEGDELSGQALNLCARPPLSGREVVEELARVTGRRIVFHPRPLLLSQLMEIGKWIVKVVGRRPGVVFPSYRDLKARALVPAFKCNLAREVLGWQPVEEREAFLDRAVRIYAPRESSADEG